MCFETRLRKAPPVSGKHMTDQNKQTEMKKAIFTNLTLILSLTLGFISCNQETKSNNQTAVTNDKTDTIIVKHKNDLNKSYEVGFLSKSYSYYWLVGNDTLDFSVNARQYEKDSTLHLSIHHKKPIIFTTTLTRINECLPQIKEDVYLTKLNSLYFRDPIYYFDLVKELSTEYEKQFGSKNISYEKLNDFLLKSKVNEQLDNFVSPLDKKIKRYSIEKFHLTDKKYFGEYLPNVDLKEYPEFAINGMGLYIQLETKRQNEDNASH
ncbi:MAG: hypothetical protein ACK6DA_14125 [Candidatus Kapaibacterium sp.]